MSCLETVKMLLCPNGKREVRRREAMRDVWGNSKCVTSGILPEVLLKILLLLGYYAA